MKMQEGCRAATTCCSWSRLFWWTVFAASFGYVEASVVVYLRRVMNMSMGLDYPVLFATRHAPFHPAGIFAELQRHDVLAIELGREAATLLLLLGAAWAAGQTRRQRWGIFGYTFAVWDLTYYLYLVLWIGFPRRLQDVDIYFLLPIPWYGPVWFPVLVCMPLILIASIRLMRAPIRTQQDDCTDSAPLRNVRVGLAASDDPEAERALKHMAANDSEQLVPKHNAKEF